MFDQEQLFKENFAGILLITSPLILIHSSYSEPHFFDSRVSGMNVM